MPNNQAHDPRVATAIERVAQAIGLSVAAVASGNSYVAKTALARQFSIDINAVGGTVGASAVNASGRVGGKPAFNDTGNTFYDDSVTFAGDNVLRSDLTEGSTGFGQLGGRVDFASHPDVNVAALQLGDEIWIATAVFFPAEWQFNVGRQKFLRLRIYAGGSSAGYLDLYLNSEMRITGDGSDESYHWINEGAPNWAYRGSSAQAVTRGVWRQIELYMCLDSVPADSGGDAEVRIWIDGSPLAPITNRATLPNSTATAEEFLLFGYYGNEGAPVDQSLYFHSLRLSSAVPGNTDANGFPFLGIVS